MAAVEPLAGVRVLVTREKSQAVKLSSRIKKLGGIPVEVPLLAFRLPENPSLLYETVSQAGNYDWIILTSYNGVEFFFQCLEKTGTKFELPQIAVIGRKTAEALRKHKIEPAFVPSKFVAESFAEEFIPRLMPGSKVLLPKGNKARSVIAEAIHESGSSCDEVILYETYCPEESAAVLAGLLKEGQLDAASFTSSSAVEFFLDICRKAGLREQADQLVIAAIGPVAAHTAEEAGLRVEACPAVNYTIDDMLRSLVHYIKQNWRNPL